MFRLLNQDLIEQNGTAPSAPHACLTSRYTKYIMHDDESATKTVSCHVNKCSHTC